MAKIAISVCLSTVLLPFIVSAQIELWEYRYETGTGCARSIASDNVGNLYIVGDSHFPGSVDYDIIVISLTNSGDERWVYRINNPGPDHGYSIVYGTDGNIYIAGKFSGVSSDFIVVSLTTDGVERWRYTYNGPGNSYDYVKSLIYGNDGNIYIAGGSYGANTYTDFTVASLSNDGIERWIYRYEGPSFDVANAIVYGQDDNLYICGIITTENLYDFAVISLTNSGAERWVYVYNGPDNGPDYGYGLVYGNDNNIYATGESRGIGTGQDITVISLINSGFENWVYRYSGSGYGFDRGLGIVYGLDNNLYISGESGPLSNYDMIVISLTNSGVERWCYTYGGTANEDDGARSIVYDWLDNRIYVAGFSRNSGTYLDFTVISLTSAGEERWVYLYNGPANSYDCATSLVYRTNDSLYVAGSSVGIDTSDDAIVIALLDSLLPGISEEGGYFPNRDNLSLFGTFIKGNRLQFNLLLSSPSTVNLSVYDILSRCIASRKIFFSAGITEHQFILPQNLPTGIYFLKAECEEFSTVKKFIHIREEP